MLQGHPGGADDTSAFSLQIIRGGEPRCNQHVHYTWAHRKPRTFSVAAHNPILETKSNIVNDRTPVICDSHQLITLYNSVAAHSAIFQLLCDWCQPIWRLFRSLESCISPDLGHVVSAMATDDDLLEVQLLLADPQLSLLLLSFPQLSLLLLNFRCCFFCRATRSQFLSPPA